MLDTSTCCPGGIPVHSESASGQNTWQVIISLTVGSQLMRQCSSVVWRGATVMTTSRSDAAHRLVEKYNKFTPLVSRLSFCSMKVISRERGAPSPRFSSAWTATAPVNVVHPILIVVSWSSRHRQQLPSRNSQHRPASQADTCVLLQCKSRPSQDVVQS